MTESCWFPCVFVFEWSSSSSSSFSLGMPHAWTSSCGSCQSSSHVATWRTKNPDTLFCNCNLCCNQKRSHWQARSQQRASTELAQGPTVERLAVSAGRRHRVAQDTSYRLACAARARPGGALGRVARSAGWPGRTAFILGFLFFFCSHRHVGGGRRSGATRQRQRQRPCQRPRGVRPGAELAGIQG